MHSITHFVICLFIIGSVICDENIECNKESADKLDEIIMKVSVFGDPNGRYAINETDFKALCLEEEEALKWFHLYIEKCLKDLSLHLFTLVANDFDAVSRKFCDSPKLRKIATSWGRCGNSAHNETVKCWNNYVLDIERLNIEKARIPDRDKVSLICCYYYQFDHCIEESFHSVGGKDCPTPSAEGLHSLLTEATGKVMEFICAEYRADNDKCDSLFKRYHHLNDVKLNKSLRKSPFNAFINIIDNTPEISKFLENSDYN